MGDALRPVEPDTLAAEQSSSESVGRAARRIEERIGGAEYQLESMKKVRRAALFGGVPFLALIAAAVFPVLDISLVDAIALLPSSVMGVVLGGTAALGLGAHRGVRRAEERLERLEEERARLVGRVARRERISSGDLEADDAEA